jgi:hypothetical protein
MPPKVFRIPQFRFRYAQLVPTISMLLLLIVPAVRASLAQTRSMRVSGARARVVPTLGSHRPSFPSRGFGPIATRSFGHRAFVRGFAFRRHRHFRFLVNACLNDPFFDPFFCRRLFFNNPFLFSEPILLPYPIYTESSYAPPEEPLSTEPNQQSELNWKIDRLTDEVERLQDRQAVGEKPQQAAVGHQAAGGNLPSRILVFRNGQREEIQNYAMVGDTLWILTEQRARKIAVSDLDMETTKKENGERGLEFP